MNKNLLIIIVVAIVVGAGAFYAGMKYQSSKRSLYAGGFQGQQSSGYRQRFGQAGGTVRGQILSISDDSITVKLTDGSTKIIVLSDTTSYVKSASGAKSDLIVGDSIMAFGTQNSDGSVTAQNIQLNPSFRGSASSSAK